jgi:hypothetical protein
MFGVVEYWSRFEKMNVEHPTSNVQHRTNKVPSPLRPGERGKCQSEGKIDFPRPAGERVRVRGQTLLDEPFHLVVKKPPD